MPSRPIADVEDGPQALAMTRADFLRTAEPDLIADVRMYATADGGRKTPALPGWGVPMDGILGRATRGMRRLADLAG